MVLRCRSPKSPSWPGYGGRGIKVCDAWASDFAAFLRDMGSRPAGRYALDRIDNDGHYEPGNVRWATWEESNRNTSRNRFLTINGEQKTATEWAKIHGLSPATVFSRMDKGWPLEKVLSPTRKNQWA